MLPRSPLCSVDRLYSVCWNYSADRGSQIFFHEGRMLASPGLRNVFADLLTVIAKQTPIFRVWLTYLYRGADKSLAKPGRKQARKHVRDARDFNNIETRAVIKFLFLQCKAPKEIRAILTETLACFLPGRAKDVSAPLYVVHLLLNIWCRFLIRRVVYLSSVLKNSVTSMVLSFLKLCVWNT